MQNKKIVPKTCSFCGNQIVENMKAVRNKNGEFICSDCISKCYGWAFGKDTKHDHAKANTENLSSIPKPKEIKAFLDEYVIGQEAA